MSDEEEDSSKDLLDIEVFSMFFEVQIFLIFPLLKIIIIWQTI